MASTSVRNLRIMLIGGILFTGIATTSVYLAKRRSDKGIRRTPVTAMDVHVSHTADGFKMSRTEGGKTVFKAVAKRAVDFRETGKSQLEDVEIFIFGKNGDRNDKITTAHCDYDSTSGQFYADGIVEIDLASLPGSGAPGSGAPGSGAPSSGAPAADAAKPVAVVAPDGTTTPTHQPVHITTSGMLYDQKKNTASTDRDLHFTFAQGTGDAKGAIFDSTNQTLWLKSNVLIHVTKGNPADVHATELRYFERLHQVQLTKPVIIRAGQKLLANTGTMYLDEKQQAKSALLEGDVHGINDSVTPATAIAPAKTRHTELFASRLDMNLDAKQHVHDATATSLPGTQVRMDSMGPSGQSQAQAARLEMDLSGPGNTLNQAQWKGNSRVVFSPVPGQPRSQTRVITADQIEMNMKPGGKELANARTVTPGRVEMTGGGEPKRVMTAKSIWAGFSDRNALHELRANGKVRTESDPPATAPAGSPVRVTESDRLDGTFNAQQQLERMEQSGGFVYTEGDRHGLADSAVYTLPPGAASGTGSTVLVGHPGADPRVWDPGGAVIAKTLTLPEKSGDSIAEGDVRATQIQAKDSGAKGKPKSPGIFGGTKKDGKDSDDPIHIVTNVMHSDRRTGLSHYEGGPGGKVRMWQGDDVIEARVIDMDKNAKKMVAVGDVWSSLVQNGKEPLRVQSDRFNYSDLDHHARYEGNVILRSSDMTVTSAIVDAWLRPADEVAPGESRLERAIANGKVHLNQPALAKADADAKHKPHPARQSDSDTAIYTTDDDKIVLTGGPPIVRDEVRGSTTGRELTWLTADDKIFVDGGPDLRTLTQHRVVKKQP